MFLIDSSIWLDHFIDQNPKATEILKTELVLFSSLLIIFEVKRRLVKLKLSKEFVKYCLDFIEKSSITIDLDSDIINSAVDLSLNFNLGTVDSLIYSSALSKNAVLITSDNDFRNLDNVQIINKL